MRHTTHDGDGISTAVESIKSDLTNLRRDLGGLAQSAVSHGKDSAQAIREGATQRFDAGAKAVRRYVKDRPLTSLAVVFGIGFLAAKLWRFR